MGIDKPIVALTANVMPNDISCCIDSGCNAFLSKPVHADEVIRTVAPYLRRTQRSKPVEPSAIAAGVSQSELLTTVQEPDRTRVLVVDDAQDLTALYQRLLNQKGFDAVTASDGYSAIQIAKRTRPEIVLLDINLPDMSGLDQGHESFSWPGEVTVHRPFRTVLDGGRAIIASRRF